MARDFNGTTDRIDYGNVDAVAAQAQTFSALVYVDAINTNDMVFAKHQNGDANWAIFFRINTNKIIQFIVNCATSDLYHTSNINSFSFGEWFHLLVTWDGSTTAANSHIYVNNSEVTYATTTNGVGAIETPAGSWSLGGWIPADNANLNGRMAEVGWWNRVLTTAERTILYKRFSPKFILNGLKFAPDLIRNQRDPISGQTGTLDGTTVIEHPRIILPQGVV